MPAFEDVYFSYRPFQSAHHPTNYRAIPQGSLTFFEGVPSSETSSCSLDDSPPDPLNCASGTTMESIHSISSRSLQCSSGS